MPLVYVHGVANRTDDHGFTARSELRDGLFRQFLLPVIGDPATAKIHTPYWGGEAGKLRWDGSSFPSALGVLEESLGAEDDSGLPLEAAAAEQPADPERILLAVARRDLSDVVDLIYSIGPEPTGDLTRDLTVAATRLVGYLKQRETAVPDESDGVRYPWLADVEDDADLLDQLLTVATPMEERQEFLGVGDPVREWLAKARTRARRGAAALRGAPVTAVVGVLRRPGSSLMATAVGDIFAYLGRRGDAVEPGAIVRCVLQALDEAASERTGKRQLTVVAHSLGGVITYDLLSHYRPDLVVDRFVTVGSQVGLFAELGLFHASDPALPTPAQPRIDPPETIREWINVVDRADPLAFRAEPIFRRVTDYRYPSGAVWAHGAYLRQPRFHERLAARLERLSA